MSGPTLRDAIAGAVAEAKHHRAQARRLREHRRACRARRDPIAALRALSAVHERELLARAADVRAAELRAQLRS